ncbi:hypothetical protein BP6252_05409 [Coleophoma cylindrospora]|uniref:Uncharacterized protein n=1 Tax=Coleophoma cylindrospora TaxID=1849047 RepID=A0A3D8RTR7_9HELO|nr:hypothetical protein BP6252_05409 [Coleophoma cylindrospora]
MASMLGKVIAITGGASGMGLATARLLAARGAKVSIADVQGDLLQEAATLIKSDGKGDVMTSIVDVRDSNSVASWMKETKENFGALDGAANIAGVFRHFPGGTVATEDEKNWDFMLGVNLTGVMHCLRAQLPVMKDGGSIVNAASILGLQGAVGCAAYAASKHGVIGLTRSAAKEVGSRGIRVNCIAPGYIQTPMLKAATADPNAEDQKEGGASSVALGRMGQAEEVAPLIAFLLSHEASFISGQCYGIDGGWNC